MSEDRNDLFERNLDAMCDLLAAGCKTDGERRVGLELERVLVDGDGKRIFFSGTQARNDDRDGVHAILSRLAADRPDLNRVDVGGHLMGFSYRFAAPDEDDGILVAVSLEPGAQIEVSVGPARHAKALLAAIDAFDADVLQAARELGVEACFAARGYDPACIDPRDVELIPKERYKLMDAYLPARGRYARDMMRCSGSTQVSVDYRSEADAARLARRATVLGPILSFLFDNAPHFRGEETSGMARSRIWRAVDPVRCGTVPGSLDAGFGFRSFCSWVASVPVILFSDRDGVTYDAKNRLAADYMRDRVLTNDELMHLISMTWPTFRLKGYLECREMDALPPRLAVACAVITVAVLYADDLERVLPFAWDALTEADVAAARAALEDNGWDASPYGAPIADIAAALAERARREHPDGFDRASIDLFATMWAHRRLPRTYSLEELESMGR